LKSVLFLVSLPQLNALTNLTENITSLVKALVGGDRKSLARAITIVENELDGSEELLKSINAKDIPVIGFTGPPGAGKSTLINAFLRKIISENKKAAIVAVDPTSPFNLGSLLGDRLRMAEHFNNDNIFIRSMATRGSLGGLTEKIIEVCDLLRAADFDFIVIETVGVGQSEVEIAGLADTTVVILVPESGDDIQALKSGIMEIADIFLVNKSDREGAALFANNLKKILAHKSDSGWEVPVLNTVATSGEGINELYDIILRHRNSKNFNEKKVFLLVEKAFRLISNKRMNGLGRQEIRKILEKEAQKSNFNLYRFVEQFKN
jgi:LAO/AO transport system kinase